MNDLEKRKPNFFLSEGIRFKSGRNQIEPAMKQSGNVSRDYFYFVR